MASTSNKYAGLSTYPAYEKTLKTASIALSIVVVGLVIVMRRYKIPVPDGWDVGFLPAVNATINALTAVALLFSLYFVKKQQFLLHRNANATALGLSVLFLLCYVVYHITTPEVLYGDANGDGSLSTDELAAVGSMRTIYLSVLFSHILLAGLLLPFILFTTIRAAVGQYAAHKKLARWVWPLWLYVAITGPLVYWMLRPYYA